MCILCLSNHNTHGTYEYQNTVFRIRLFYLICFKSLFRAWIDLTCFSIHIETFLVFLDVQEFRSVMYHIMSFSLFFVVFFIEIGLVIVSMRTPDDIYQLLNGIIKISSSRCFENGFKMIEIYI